MLRRPFRFWIRAARDRFTPTGSVPNRPVSGAGRDHREYKLFVGSVNEATVFPAENAGVAKFEDCQRANVVATNDAEAGLFIEIQLVDSARSCYRR